MGSIVDDEGKGGEGTVKAKREIKRKWRMSPLNNFNSNNHLHLR